MRRPWRAAELCLAIAASALLASAAGAPGILLDVPFLAQKKNGCGAASLAMVMQFWERQSKAAISANAQESTIENALDPKARGISNAAMAEYLSANEYRVFAFAGRWSDLRENLAKGRPLIVALETKGAKGPLHYAVVAGVDWQRDFVFLNDPAQRKLLRIERGDFEREWKVTGDWTLLAVPKPGA